MNTAGSKNVDDRPERTLSALLARLRTLPVDTSRLETRLRQQLPCPPAVSAYRFVLLRPVRMAAAASIIMGIVLAAILASSAGPALASPQQLAQAHEEMVSGHPGMMMVDSMQAASAALARRWSHAPALPDMPDENVTACCVHHMGRKKMACVSMTVDGVPLTMAVADSAEITVPAGHTIERNGVSWRVDSCKGVNMAMTQRNGRWLCFMGRLPVDRLIEVGGQLRL